MTVGSTVRESIGLGDGSFVYWAVCLLNQADDCFKVVACLDRNLPNAPLKLRHVDSPGCLVLDGCENDVLRSKKGKDTEDSSQAGKETMKIFINVGKSAVYTRKCKKFRNLIPCRLK